MFDYKLVPVIDPGSITGCLPVKDFMDTFDPAYETTWPEAVDYMLESPSESANVHLLMDEYFQDGKFHTPVRVQLPQSDIEDRYTYSACVTNGMHRTVTSSLYGLPITFSYYYVHPEIRETDQFTIATITFDYLDNSFKAYEEASCWFRSFRLPDGKWVESWTSSNGRDTIELWFDEQLDHEVLYARLEAICSNEHMSKYNWKKIELVDVSENEMYPDDEE